MSQHLQEHLRKDHFISKSSEYIGEIVYGGIDGIVTTFAVVAWFAWAWATETLGQIWPLAVVLFGLANLFWDGVSMGLWKYLSTKSEQDIYHREWHKEAYAIKQYTASEVDESIEILMEQGMKSEDATQMVGLMRSYPDLRLKWQMDNELAMADVRDDNAILQGVITLFSFIVFGAIPLIPYLFLPEGYDYRIVSLIVTSASLVLLGVVRRYITKMNFVTTVSQMVILGAVAAGVAYWTGDLVMRMQ